MIRKHVTVRGEVQGVGFRWNTRAEARRLGVCGWVRNQRDGSVEVELEGSENAVGRMLDWLRHGPRYARVDGLDVTTVPPLGETGFRII